MNVKENDSFEVIWKKLGSCKNVLMTLHAAPDGDSLGACAGMKYVLERDFGCEVELISGDELAENLSNLSFAKEVNIRKDIGEIELEGFDCLLSLDTASQQMLGSWKANYEVRNVFVINMDHHGSNSRYGNLNYVDSEQPSACSVLVDFLKSSGVKFDRELSSRLLLGVCTDSGFFSYDTSPHKAIADAAFLIENGANYLNDILRPVLYNKPLRLLKFQGLLIRNLKYNDEGGFGYSVVSQNESKDLELSKAEVRAQVNDLQFISEFDFVFTLVDVGDYIKGSFRSKKGVDVSELATELGGGGHKFAAGFVLENMSLGEAEKKVLDVVERIRKRS